MLPSPAPNPKTYSFPKKGSLSPLLLLPAKSEDEKEIKEPADEHKTNQN
jgi:hypothetical protein